MPLPDEGIKIAALPAASSPDAIDLVGVQAGVTKKLASTLLATQAELDAEATARINADALKANDNAVVHLAGAETLTGAKAFTANIIGTGADNQFGAGASGGAGTFIDIGSAGDAANGWLLAGGSPANVGIIIQPKGTGVVRLRDNAGNSMVLVGPNAVGFFGAAPLAQQTITGSRGGNVALQNLLQALQSHGLLTNGTTA